MQALHVNFNISEVYRAKGSLPFTPVSQPHIFLSRNQKPTSVPVYFCRALLCTGKSVCVCKTPMHPRYTAWQVIFTFQCILENFSISRRAASLSFSWFHNIPLYKYIGHNTYVYFPNHLSLENLVLPPILTPKLIRQRNWLELIWNYLL